MKPNIIWNAEYDPGAGKEKMNGKMCEISVKSLVQLIVFY